ncbi:unnamed protein product [Effrenium voratum]|nr:unnamed protein product [Effrenium voratum]
MAMPRVQIKVVLDFMCPWSLIGLRSLALAKERFAARLDFAVELLPFEFDPPGTYPQEGLDWTEYCKGFGPAKAKFLLEEKLPRAFALGEDLGIRFRMERRIVHTVDVNTALALAQRLGSPAAEGFALASLRAHFEELQDPNEAAGLRKRLQDVGVPLEALEAALSDPEKESKNALRTAQARPMLRSGVPHFEIRCGGPDLCAGVHGGPTRPSYFEEIFQRCLPQEEL